MIRDQISIVCLNEPDEIVELVAFAAFDDAQAAVNHANSRLRYIWAIWPYEDAFRDQGYPDCVAPVVDEIFTLFPTIPDHIRDDLCFLIPSRNDGVAQIEFTIRKLDLDDNRARRPGHKR